jgi:cytoskeletal protein RodZ
MKKMLTFLAVIFAVVAFAGGVMAQEKKAETPASVTEKPKAEKPKAPKEMKTSGIVATYEMGKAIKVKDKKKEMAFDIVADTKVTGEVKEGAKVKVSYRKEGEKMIATNISSTPAASKPKPQKMEKKAGETK